MAGTRTAERGAALLIVMVAVTVLTVLATDLAYEARLSLQIAANARDDLRATSLAKGGVALSRLVLGFQQQIDDTMGKAAGAARGAGVSAMPRPQLWRLVPVSSAFADGLFGGAAGPLPAEGDGEGARAAAGPPPGGDFVVQLDDEARKVNVQLDNSDALVSAQVQALYQLICDPQWDALFDREDANGLRVSRQELLVYLRDWVDLNSESSALVASFPPGGCAMVTPTQNAFESGFQDENFPYDRGEDRYRTKNARMDSLAELHLVAGVTDAFMAAFGDAITVYLPRDAQQTVNETDPALLRNLAARMATQPDQAALRDAGIGARLQQAVLLQTYGGMFSIGPGALGDIVASEGIDVNRNLLAGTSSPFTDRSRAFRVRSQGRAGDVTKQIDAVVWLPANATPGLPATTPVPGKLVHWREE